MGYSDSGAIRWSALGQTGDILRMGAIMGAGFDPGFNNLIGLEAERLQREREGKR